MAPLAVPTIRPAVAGDMPAVQAIYAHHVLHGTASFEEVPPDTAEMESRWRKVTDAGLPWLVAHQEGATLGYCYAGPYRARPAYRFTVENSIYIAPDLGGRGLGTALISALIAACEGGPWRQMLAVIGDSGNTGSIALHRRAGFEHVGILRSVGFKHGRWLDSVLMQRALGPGDHSHPD